MAGRANRNCHPSVMPVELRQQRAECESRMCAHDHARAMGLDDVAGPVVRTVLVRKAKAKPKAKAKAKPKAKPKAKAKAKPKARKGS